MLGFRGASRYVSENFRDCFELECRALKKARDEMGLTNIQIMIPFVRTVAEAKRVIELLAQNGLKRGENGLKVIMMCELPTNALLAEQFLEHFDRRCYFLLWMVIPLLTRIQVRSATLSNLSG